ncbi:MAG: glycosyltransferase [Verrucomicrobiaceae bacterium]|nr:MAG: glycosyltransferase [Verrucomicrobiaceae bacterium]
MTSQPSFLFICASTPWVGALAENLAREYPTAIVDIYDWFTLRRARRNKWPILVPSAVTRATWSYPPTYLSHLRRPFACLGRQRLKCFVESHVRCGALTDPWIVCPYPWYVRWLRSMRKERLVYFNLDDYFQYYPEARAPIIANQEQEMVESCAVTLCLSQFQVDVLRSRYPHCAGRIRHFPLGVMEEFINQEAGEVRQGDTVGYVGNLTDRIDWDLVREVAQAMPQIKFVFVGSLDDGPWTTPRARALSLENVFHKAQVPQQEVSRFYWDFSISWIPYNVGHPFNRACCPTKLMDGLASGRPLVSTDVPECRLYPEWIAIVQSPEDAVHRISEALRNARCSIRTARQIAFVREYTWAARAASFVPALCQK